MRIEVPSPSASCPASLGHSLRSETSEDSTGFGATGFQPYPSSAQFLCSTDSNSSASSASGESRIRPIGTTKENRGSVQPLKFKTQLCGYYLRGENCPYAPWCAFAHGEEEVRTVKGNVADGVRAVNTLPRTMVFHEVWVQTTKFTRKTGPSTPEQRIAAQAPPPAPSFMRKSSAQKPQQPMQHNPYGSY